MYNVHIPPKYTSSLINDLKQVLHLVEKHNNLNDISSSHIIQYSCRVARRVNEEETKSEGKKNTP